MKVKKNSQIKMLWRSAFIRLISVLFLLLNLQLHQANCQFLDQTGQHLEIGQNFRIYPGEVSQTEVFITKSPVNDNLIFSSCNTLNFIPFFVSEGVYVSDDGGFTWRGNDTCTGSPVTFHGGDPGITIDKEGTFILTRLGRAPFTGLFSHYSTDNGLTWSEQVPISTDDLERASVASDPFTSSDHFGRTYAVWVKFAQPFPLMFAFTDDGAMNWSNPAAVNMPETRSAGGDVAVGPDGTVYACWAGVTQSSPFKEIVVGFAHSGDGGSVWQVDESAFDVNGITGILEEKQNIRVNGLPVIAVDTTSGPFQGNIYIVTAQKDMLPAGADPDIILHRSEDGGLTWSEGIRVNQDLLDNGKIQYFPAVHVDRFGAVNVIFYDDRNTTADSTGVMLARSTDGGESWKEWVISDHHFKPLPIGGLGQGYQGDNIDLTSTDSHILPVWMDNSTGVYQVWSARIDFSSINDIDDLNHLTAANLERIYPNPFSGQLIIDYKIVNRSRVTLKIFDARGKVLEILVNSIQSPGNYSKGFFAGDEYPPGIYFIQLVCDGMSEVEKVVLMK